MSLYVVFYIIINYHKISSIGVTSDISSSEEKSCKPQKNKIQGKNLIFDMFFGASCKDFSGVLQSVSKSEFFEKKKKSLS